MHATVYQAEVLAILVMADALQVDLITQYVVNIYVDCLRAIQSLTSLTPPDGPVRKCHEALGDTYVKKIKRFKLAICNIT